jgi:deoxyribonuclease IV
MPLLGAHMSIAGGYYKAVDAAASFGMDCVQIFTKNNNQWAAKPLSAEDVDLFREAIARTGIRKPCAHDSYLINLASSDDVLWTKSFEAFVIELQRADALGLDGVVMHPGACVGCSEEEGIRKVVAAFDRAFEITEKLNIEVWVETTAGQGSSLGHRFEHLREIINGVQSSERLGVCIDTCHLFAAGYALGSPDEYEATMRQFDEIIGLNRVRAFHLNDSKKEFASRVDRHAHIGKGHLGRQAFRNVVNDPRFVDLPMYLETPKETIDGRVMDAVNLAALRRLSRAARKRPQIRKNR